VMSQLDHSLERLAADSTVPLAERRSA